MLVTASLFADIDDISVQADQLLRNGDYYKAVIEYTKLIKEEKDDADLFLKRGDC